MDVSVKRLKGPCHGVHDKDPLANMAQGADTTSQDTANPTPHKPCNHATGQDSWCWQKNPGCGQSNPPSNNSAYSNPMPSSLNPGDNPPLSPPWHPRKFVHQHVLTKTIREHTKYNEKWPVIYNNGWGQLPNPSSTTVHMNNNRSWQRDSTPSHVSITQQRLSVDLSHN